MSVTSLLSFKDTTRDIRAEFRRQVGSSLESCGNAESSARVPLNDSELSHREYNEVFEGDSWSFEGPRASTFSVKLRPMTFVSSGNPDATISEKAEDRGPFRTSRRSHAHFALGDGNDTATFAGNQQRNIGLIEADTGHKTINLDLGRGDDKAVLYLNDISGVIRVDGGKGEDSLEIRAKDSRQQFEILSGAQAENVTFDPDRLYIVADSIEKFSEFRGGEHRSTWGSF